MRPSQAPSASSSCQNFVVVRNKGLKSKIPVSAGFLAVQGRLLSGKFPRKRPEIRLFHRADASQGCALACIQRAGRTVTIVARTVGSKVASLGVDLPCKVLLLLLKARSQLWGVGQLVGRLKSKKACDTRAPDSSPRREGKTRSAETDQHLAVYSLVGVGGKKSPKKQKKTRIFNKNRAKRCCRPL